MGDESNGSPGRLKPMRTSIGGSTKQPTEEAVEEMKRRFLSGNGSPAITPQKVAGSNSSTPRRRSRSRSRPRSSVGGNTATTIDPTPKGSDDNDSTFGPSSRPLRTSASTSSLRLRYQRTGDTTTDFGTETDIGFDQDAYRILPDRTGESTKPLRIRRNNTGTTAASLARDMTGSTDLVSEQRTGDTEYVTAQETGGTYCPLEPQRTGEPVKAHRTGERVSKQHTGEGRVRRQRTGDSEVPTHQTGSSDLSQVVRQRTSDNQVHRQRIGDGDVATIRRRDFVAEQTSTEYGLRRDRTGDAEVESLLGPIGSMFTGDLIDLSPASSLSRIPQRVGARVSARGGGDYQSRLELGFRTGSSSASSVASSGYESSVSSIPDLASDFSDTTSIRSGGPSTPPSVSPPSKSATKAHDSYRYGSQTRNSTPTPRSRAKSVSHGLGISTSDFAKDERCAKCMMPLFSVKHGGKYVTVPEEPTSTGAAPKRYHTACFKCTVCGEIFEEKEGGHAVFVRVEEGACHVRVSVTSSLNMLFRYLSPCLVRTS